MTPRKGVAPSIEYSEGRSGDLELDTVGHAAPSRMCK